MFEYPNQPAGTAEEQCAYLRRYLYTMTDELNAMLQRVEALENQKASEGSD